jgi:serine-type D-Ala-D-Ala carboxypeptidase/endopeptidase (penicillin-binding protein 4)
MKLSHMLRFFLGLFAGVALLSMARAQGLPKEVTQALARAGVPASSLSLVVQALPLTAPSSATGTATASQSPVVLAPVLKHRVDAVMNPASVMKLITTYAALDQLGPDFTWKTVFISMAR